MWLRDKARIFPAMSGHVQKCPLRAVEQPGGPSRRAITAMGFCKVSLPFFLGRGFGELLASVAASPRNDVVSDNAGFSSIEPIFECSGPRKQRQCHFTCGAEVAAKVDNFRIPDLYGQSLPDLIVVSRRVTQDHHDHSAQ